jgi:hypothetical protein
MSNQYQIITCQTPNYTQYSEAYIKRTHNYSVQPVSDGSLSGGAVSCLLRVCSNGY